MLIKDTTINDFEANDLCPFFKYVDRGGRHRSGQNTPNICMVTPGSGEKYYFLGVRVEDGRNNCYIWKVALKIV